MMKRKLNTNGFGWRIAVAACVLIVLLPLLFYALAVVSHAVGQGRIIFYRAMAASALVGAAVILVLAILVAVETAQDQLYHRSYLRQQGDRLPLADGRYECQYCGNRQVQAADAHCAVCGKALR